MEKNEAFKKAVAAIKALEEKLVVCGNTNKVCEHSAQEAEKEIEEYFAKILNLLAARKATLLESVQQHQITQKQHIEETRGKLEKSLEAFNHGMKTASMMYTLNQNAAESILKTISDTPTPNVCETIISIELPPKMFETIQQLGKVEILDHCSVASETLIALGKVEISDHFSVADMVSTFAGSSRGNADGNGLKAQFSSPFAICHSPHDDCLYVCDQRYSSVRKVTMQGDVSTFVASSIGLVSPSAIAVYHKEKSFVVGDIGTNTIYKITQSGTLSVIAGSGQRGQAGYQDGPAASARFNYPWGIGVDQQTGTIYVSEYNNHVIRKITPQGEVSTLAGSQGRGFADGTGAAAKFNSPWMMCFDEKTNSLLVCDTSNNKLRQVQLNGVVSTLCHIQSPVAVALAPNGNIFVTQFHNKICKVTPTQSSGKQYEVGELAGSGAEGRIDGKPAESAFNHPRGIVVHEPSHSCYVTDHYSYAIRKISFATSV